MSGYRFVGPKGFVGIPARDLTDDQFRALPAMDRRRVRESTVYVPIHDDDIAPPAPALTNLKRAELDALATELGVDKPDELKNRDDVIAAIEAARTAPDASGDQQGAS